MDSRENKIISLLSLIVLLVIVIINMQTIVDFFDKNISFFEEQLKIITADQTQVNYDEIVTKINNNEIVINHNGDIFYPYYEILSDNQKSLYIEILDHVNNYKNVFEINTSISKEEVGDVIDAVYYDHPELIWMESGYSLQYIENTNWMELTLNFNDLIKDIDNNIIEFNNVVDPIINEASTLSNDYEKEKYIHDEIIKLVEYDDNATLNQSAYSALVSKTSVCAGYSRAFQYLLMKLNIPTYYITGYSSGDHGWNIVKLGDNYYNVDVTWDDQDEIYYTYFNQKDSDIANTHTRTGLSVNLPTCVSDEFSNTLSNAKDTYSISFEQ